MKNKKQVITTHDYYGDFICIYCKKPLTSAMLANRPETTTPYPLDCWCGNEKCRRFGLVTFTGIKNEKEIAQVS